MHPRTEKVTEFLCNILTKIKHVTPIICSLVFISAGRQKELVRWFYLLIVLMKFVDLKLCCRLKFRKVFNSSSNWCFFVLWFGYFCLCIGAVT